MKCAVIANGYYHGEAMSHQINSLCQQLSVRGVKVDIVYTDKLISHISHSNAVATLGKVDFVVFLDKDVYISHLLEKSGYKLINSAKSIELCDDKMKTYLALANSGVNIPDTVSSPLNYAGKQDDFYIEIEKLFSYPIVIKEVFGSMGRTVYLANNREELIALRNKLISVPHLYQKFIGCGGMDFRVIVIGGKSIGCMQRSNPTDFRSNIELGGTGSLFDLNPAVANIAEKSAQVLGLDYCGVDVLYDGEKYYVCEVNSNAFFKGFQNATGINVAAIYADYLIGKFAH